MPCPASISTGRLGGYLGTKLLYSSFRRRPSYRVLGCVQTCPSPCEYRLLNSYLPPKPQLELTIQSRQAPSLRLKSSLSRDPKEPSEVDGRPEHISAHYNLIARVPLETEPHGLHSRATFRVLLRDFDIAAAAAGSCSRLYLVRAGQGKVLRSCQHCCLPRPWSFPALKVES